MKKKLRVGPPEVPTEIVSRTDALHDAADALWIALQMLDFSQRPATKKLLQETLRKTEAATVMGYL